MGLMGVSSVRKEDHHTELVNAVEKYATMQYF
jgi:hypothetical protein